MYKRSVLPSSRFVKKLKKASDDKRNLILAAIDKFRKGEDASLRIHKLHGVYNGYWSFDADYDLRVIYSINKTGIATIHGLENFGTHKELYGI